MLSAAFVSMTTYSLRHKIASNLKTHGYCYDYNSVLTAALGLWLPYFNALDDLFITSYIMHIATSDHGNVSPLWLRGVCQHGPRRTRTWWRLL